MRLRLTVVAIVITAAVGMSAQSGLRVYTIQDLFQRNVGSPEQQNKPFPPHRIIGNVYYVGTESLSSFLVTTPAGHVLIDTAYERTVPTIKDSVEQLGFKFNDIKIVLGSHSHGDHQEGDGLVVQMTGATAMAMAEDIPPLLAMRSPGGVPRPMYESLHDGSEVKIGDTTLTAHWTPGHTPGCTTWTLTAQDGGKSYDVLIIGSVGVNPGTNLVGNPALVAQYKQSFAYLKGAHVDVPLGSHPGMFGLADKFGKLKPGGPNPYIDPQGFKDEVTIQETAFLNELRRQQVEGPPPPRGRGAGRGAAPGRN
ncbi:MAG TPA: subclass B3 metallo-beta-lactamase [Vicinamibacterales bacterium]|jgi:metallo-beta-lactamase class B|nr:subclass B3 metallo-beta-lactamase [Vicinamibacterales bacterium]